MSCEPTPPFTTLPWRRSGQGLGKQFTVFVEADSVSEPSFWRWGPIGSRGTSLL